MTPTHLRLISFLEGVSFIILLGIAMPLKYMFDKPFLVPYAGMAHGVLFILFLGLLLVVCQIKGWSLKVFIIGLIASVVPFMLFWFERYVYQLEMVKYDEIKKINKKVAKKATFSLQKRLFLLKDFMATTTAFTNFTC